MTGHIYNGRTPTLKFGAVYGANGAGKSNLIRAFEFLKTFCKSPQAFSSLSALRHWYKANRFMLPVREGKSPISLMVEFSKKGRAYIYNVEIGESGVSLEELYESGEGHKNNKLIMRRTLREISFPQTEVPKAIIDLFHRQIRVAPYASAIALNGNLRMVNDSRTIDAYKWFKDDLITIRKNRNLPELINIFCTNTSFKTYVNDVFTQIGLGIKEVDVEERGFEDWLAELDDEEREQLATQHLPSGPDKALVRIAEDLPELSIREKDGQRLVDELLFRQYGLSGYIGEMKIQAQSDGTTRLLTLMPLFYQATNRDDACVVIDELDNGIHPKLMQGIIRFFGASKTKGQVIFTTHESSLLDQQRLLRPDETWIVDKAEGTSDIYSFNAFKLHNTLSMENGYMEGRFGGVPKITLKADEN